MNVIRAQVLTPPSTLAARVASLPAPSSSPQPPPLYPYDLLDFTLIGCTGAATMNLQLIAPLPLSITMLSSEQGLHLRFSS
ncbi:MAG: hypothetical protein P8163_02375 [Candidatus Thiodiazotropha sp.]